jgi:hypothetical protein
MLDFYTGGQARGNPIVGTIDEMEGANSFNNNFNNYS